MAAGHLTFYDKNKASPLTKAADEGNTAEVKKLIESKANVNALDGNFQSPLRRACFGSKWEEVIPLLLEAKANVNGVIDNRDGIGEPVLHTALYLRNIPLVKFFVAAGADPKVKDNRGRDATYMAELYGVNIDFDSIAKTPPPVAKIS